MDDEDGYGGRPKHLVRHAAQRHLNQAGPLSRSDYNESSPVLVGYFK
jgi:hypothetical protein